MENFKFGFEYECLVEVLNPFFLTLLNKLKTNGYLLNNCKVSYNETENNSNSIDTYDSKDSEFMRIIHRQNNEINELLNINKQERFLMAAVLNCIDPNIQFNASTTYKYDPCYIYPLIHHLRPSINPQIWTLTFDNSVKKENCNFPFYSDSDCLTKNRKQCPENLWESIEIVSPILTWNDITNVNKNKNSFYKIFNDILPGNNSFKYWHNKTSSNHVHISKGGCFNISRILIKICMGWWYFETLFLTLVKKWRSKNNSYCKHMSEIMKSNNDEIFLFYNLNELSYKHILDSKNTDLVFQIISLFQSTNKNVAFNLLNLPKLSTIEVRIKESSSNTDKNIMFMKLLAYFIDACIRNKSISLLASNEQKELCLNCYKSFKVDDKKNLKILLDSVWTMFETFVSKDDKYKDDRNNVIQFWKNISKQY